MYPYRAQRGIGDPGIYPQYIGDPGIHPQAECVLVAGCGPNVGACGPNANVGACGGPSYVGAPAGRGGGWRGGGGWGGGRGWGWGGYHPWFYASYASYDPYQQGYAGYGDGSQCVYDQRTGRYVCYVWDASRQAWVIVG